MASNSSTAPREGELIDIFALGHAVVDAEYRVEPDFLQALGYETGARYVLEEGPFRILSAALQAPGSGAEWEHQSGGGSAANSLVTAQRLGAHCSLATRLARDPIGWFFSQTLQNDGVGLSAGEPGEGLSGQCLVLVTPDAERTMVLHLGVTAEIRPEDVSEKTLAAARCVVLESYLLTTESARTTAEATLAMARKHARPVVISLSDPGVVRTHGDVLRHWLTDNAISLVIGNTEEAQALTNARTPEEAAQELAEHASAVVITDGPKGALIRNENGTTRVAAPVVEARSTLGAGDTFAGALLYGYWHRQWSLHRAVEFAVRCAARSVEFSGPRLPREQLQWVLAGFSDDSGGDAD